ncbi:hypothetical protein BABINDRAFT_164642 [Babjeviella inositovora NRRL Y-12698]|uniref:DUF1765-domain-containing protein n=1 Tax=Babjeviella inositovora NRRL Y-12698 TaxID=984486 RepID=A0A1E3QZ51_9ASCO|nr:uncharacterized protein BABINDRAFT_164642 [Babjeviella inositovora NRRL Y-12698]ODQ82916.1 hypothetical protein BABINDRAFT_164642 [Babjeviella inositovora NRRL Y-12698]
MPKSSGNSFFHKTDDAKRTLDPSRDEAEALSEKRSRISQKSPSALYTLSYSHPPSDQLPSSEQYRSHLKDFKRLDSYFAKFSSKSDGVIKTNVLRLTIMTFLRTDNIDGENYYVTLNPAESARLRTFAQGVLCKWWEYLLSSLSSQTDPNLTPLQTSSPGLTRRGSTKLSSLDKSAYLECLSRILARPEWGMLAVSETATYRKLLTSTMEFSLAKLNNAKTVPLAHAAFIGKVLAHSFFALPHVANALLFLLNTKQGSLNDLVGCYFSERKLVVPGGSHEDEFIAAGRKLHLLQVFPREVQHLIGDLGRFNPRRAGHQGLTASKSRFYKKRNLAMNPVVPPVHPAPGINDPSGPWVSKWCLHGSDVFNSFLRHYLDILSSRVSGIDIDDRLMLAAPGLLVIMCHIREIAEKGVTAVGAVPLKLNPRKSSSLPRDPMKNMPTSQVAKNAHYNSMVKLIHTLRNFVATSESKLRPHFVRYFDQLLMSLATLISTYRPQESGVMLDLFSEFAQNMASDKNDYATMNIAMSIDWIFWIECVSRLVDTENAFQQLKGISFLYALWDMLPNYLIEDVTAYPSQKRYRATTPTWYSNLKESIKWNAGNWILSIPIWFKLFNHWQPLVRSYYMRLIVWKIIGLNEEFEDIDNIKHMVEMRLNMSYDRVTELISDSKECFGERNLISITPATPIINRKFVITPMVVDGGFSTGLLVGMDDSYGEMAEFLPRKPVNSMSRTHAYEILDEAVYSSVSNGSNLSFSEAVPEPKIETPPAKKPSMLFGSALRLFKKASPLASKVQALEEEEDPRTDLRDQLADLARGDTAAMRSLPSSSSNLSALSSLVRDIKSVGSLSSLSNTSRSSTPSVFSHSAPSSYEESISSSSSSFEINEAIITKASSPSSMSMGRIPPPPEFAHAVSEVTGPGYRFQIVVDNSAVNKKFGMVRFGGGANREYRGEYRGDGGSASPTIEGDSYFSSSYSADVSDLPPVPRLPKINSFFETDYMVTSSTNLILGDEGLGNDDESSDDELMISITRKLSKRMSLFTNQAATESKNSVYHLYNHLRREEERKRQTLQKIQKYGNMGRAVAEWTAHIVEFELFIAKKTSNGCMLESPSTYIPALLAEPPSNKLNAN